MHLIIFMLQTLKLNSEKLENEEKQNLAGLTTEVFLFTTSSINNNYLYLSEEGECQFIIQMQQIALNVPIQRTDPVLIERGGGGKRDHRKNFIDFIQFFPPQLFPPFRLAHFDSL